METSLPSEVTVWTIGHSTRTIEEFVRVLEAHGIKAVADVRRFPTSRRYPHFDARELQRSLTEVGIEYLPFPELGGYRRPRADSINTAWRSKGFRGYADYMETAGFQRGIERLLAMARERRSAVLCAERLWWRCHRALIADYLKARDVSVIHIEDAEKTVAHPFTSAARIIEGRLSYRRGVDGG